MPRKCLLGLVACVLFAACEVTPGTESNPRWQSVFPFDRIGEVSLRMTARELHDMKGEQLSVAGYVGYEERSDSVLIRYVFPGSMTEDRPPPARSRLDAIEAELSKPARVVDWGDVHGRLVRNLGPAKCSRVHASGRDRGFIAEWSVVGEPLLLFYIRGPAPEVPDELVLRVGEPWEFLSGPLTELEPTQCTGPQ